MSRTEKNSHTYIVCTKLDEHRNIDVNNDACEPLYMYVTVHVYFVLQPLAVCTLDYFSFTHTRFSVGSVVPFHIGDIRIAAPHVAIAVLGVLYYDDCNEKINI